LYGGAEVTGLPRIHQQSLATTAGRESDAVQAELCKVVVM